MLYDFDMKDSDAYFYNGLLMLASFTCSRILTMPYYFYNLYLVHNTEALLSTGLGMYTLWLSTLVLDTLNIGWFFKMIRGALKVIETRKTMENLHEERNSKMKRG